jgi:predicted phage tail protein
MNDLVRSQAAAEIDDAVLEGVIGGCLIGVGTICFVD